jgi:hypothetical protein
MSSTKNLIEPKLYMSSTKNLVEPKLYIIPTKNLIGPKLYKDFSGFFKSLGSIRFLAGFM